MVLLITNVLNIFSKRSKDYIIKKETKDNILKNLKDYNFNFLVYYPLPDIYEDLTLEGLYLLQELSLEY